MKIKSMLGAFALAAMMLPGTVQAQDQGDQAAKLSEARAIISVMFPPAQRDQTIKELMGNIGQSIAAVPPQFQGEPGLAKLFQDFHDTLPDRIMPIASKHLPMIFEATALAYTRAFTLAQLKDVHAFAQTPSGAYYLTHSLALMGDPAVVAANTAYMKEIQGLQAGVQQDLVAKVGTYLKAHPDVAKRIAAKKP